MNVVAIAAIDVVADDAVVVAVVVGFVNQVLAQKFAMPKARPIKKRNKRIAQ